MITKEEAAAFIGEFADVAPHDPWLKYARTVVALYDERDAALEVRDVALVEADDAAHGERVCKAERDAALIVLNELRPLDRLEWTWPDDFDGGYLAETPDIRCAACGCLVTFDTSDGGSWRQGVDVCNDCAAMRSEVLSAVTRDRDRLALELRRLRAAEAPGTDDAAFEGTGWARQADFWTHSSGATVYNRGGGWRFGLDSRFFRFALDAMRAAVPGSV